MTDHLIENQRFWDAYAPKWIERGEAAWRAEQPYWGIWATPESELALIPSDLAGRSVVELGCGTGYVSRWFEQRGASVTAVDLSRQQLATAKRFAAQFQSEITFIQSNAEATPLPTTVQTLWSASMARPFGAIRIDGFLKRQDSWCQAAG